MTQDRDLYVRPVGLYRSAAAAEDEGGTAWGGMQLAGGWLEFSAIEVIEREGRSVRRNLATLGAYLERDWGRRANAATELFQNLTEPRQRIAGLALDRPRIMGIVNVTPDSFSDGGALTTVEAAVTHARALEAEGADILDIGGESTRPGSDPVSEADELARVIPVIEALAGTTDALISIDTRKAAVMTPAAAAGCDIINDVSALSYDDEALEAAAATALPVILMHAQGDPKTMQDDPTYDDVVTDVFDYLAGRIAACDDAGIPSHRIIADPGIGFGKTLAHNLALMRSLSLFHGLGVPLLLGASRKGFIGKLSGVEVAAERQFGSVAAALAGAASGVQIVRVHDVAETRQAFDVWNAVT